MSKDKLVITGANGFLGRNTLKVASQTWETIGIVRRKETFKEISSIGGTPYHLATFTVKELVEVFTNAKAVINFLGIVSGTETEFQKINVDNFELVIKACEEAHVKRVICISGLGVDQYGKKDWATNNYFKSKKEMEKLLIESLVPYTIFRPSYILGPGDELIPDLINSLKDGFVNIIGPGTAPMQPIYVENAVQSFLRAASGVGPDNAIYDLVGPSIISMNDLVATIKSSLQKLIDLTSTSIKHLTIKEAEETLGYPKEISDIFFSDSLGDPKILEQQLNIHLSSLDEIIKHTLSVELGI